MFYYVERVLPVSISWFLGIQRTRYTTKQPLSFSLHCQSYWRTQINIPRASKVPISASKAS